MTTLSERLSRLSPEQRAQLLKQMRQQPGGAEPQRDRIGRASRDVACHPVTSAQQRMWLFQQMGENAAYNMCSAIRIDGDLDLVALDASVFALQERHESLRTTFAMQGIDLVQRIAAPQRRPMEVTDLTGLPEHQRGSTVDELVRAQAAHVFDLEQGPLFRVGLLRLAPGQHVLLANMHHIVSDGWSMTVLIRELSQLYQAFAEGRESPLAELPVQYVDYTHWQRERLGPAELESQLAYWRHALRDAPPLLDVPGDRVRPARKTFRAATDFFEFGDGLAGQVATLSRTLGVTPFIVLVAAFKALLGAYSGQTDIVVATPVANRSRSELEGVIGFFANTLLLRDHVSPDQAFAELVSRVKTSTLTAYSYQDVPYDQVVEALNPPRSTAHAPLAQVMFVVQNVPDGALELGGLRLTPIEIGREGSDFDLIVELQPAAGGYRGIITYSTDLYGHESVAALVAQYRALLSGLLSDPQVRIGDALARLRPALQTDAVADAAIVHRSRAESWHESISRRAEDGAVIGDERGEHTLASVLADANALGARLALMVPLEGSVGIALSRPADALMALLACWQAGVLPCLLDPRDADALLGGQLHACAAGLLLCDTPRSDALTTQFTSLKVMPWSEIREAIANGSMIPAWRPHTHVPALRMLASQGAVDCAHDALRAAVDAQLRHIPLREDDRVVLMRTPGTFGFVRDTLWALHGARRLDFAAVEDAAEDALRAADLISADAACLTEVSRATLSPTLRAMALTDGELTDDQSLRWFARQRAPLLHLHEVAPSAAAVICRSDRLNDDGALVSNWQSWHSGLSVRLADGAQCPDGMPGSLHIADGERHRDTGLRARRQADGGLRLIDNDARQLWRDGVRGSLDAVEALIRRQPMVKDALVLKYAAPAGVRVAAYVVSARAEALHALRETVAKALPRGLCPDMWIPVAAIPLSADGSVDSAALKSCVALDADDLSRHESMLQAQPGVERAAVALRENHHVARRHHLADAIPGWQRTLGSALDGDAVVGPDRHAQADTGASALAVGAPLPTSLPANLGDLLIRAAEGPHGVRYIDREGVEHEHSYAELLALAECTLGGLRAQGLQPGDIVVFQVPENPEFVPAFWACALGGFVPVPLAAAPTYAARNAALDKLLNTCRLLGPTAVIAGSGLAGDIEAALRKTGLEMLRVLPVLSLRATARDAAHHPAQPDDLALLLLTSGSTGMPKAVRQSHRALIARSAATAINNGFTDEEVSLNWMPLDHVGGLVMYHVLDVYLGGRQVQVATERVLQAPLLWLDLIDRYRATVTWAPNFAYALVNERLDQCGDAQWDLSCMRFVLNGGEAIVSKTARGFLRGLACFGLPGTCMRPSWGMSETCSGVVFSRLTLENSTDEDAFVEVGSPIPGVSIRIVDAEDQPVVQGRIGRLQIRGPSVTSGYLRNEDATRDAFTADGWFNTGDLAVLNGAELAITGREKDVIIVNGLNYYSHEIERVVDDTGLVQASFTAATAVREAGTDTDKLAVFFVPAGDADDARTEAAIRGIRSAVLAQCQINPAYIVPLAPDQVPKTSIGKIQRNQLAVELLDGRFDDLLRDQDLLAGNANTVPAWFFRRRWRVARLRVAAAAVATTCLAFVRDAAQADAMRTAGPEYARVLSVEIGDGFSACGADRYLIDPHRPEQFDALFAALAAEGIAIDRIAWFWALPDTAMASAVESNAPVARLDRILPPLIGLLKTLSRQDAQHSIRLAIAAGMASDDADDGDVSTAVLPGLLKTAALEMAHVQPVAVYADAMQPETVARMLCEELASAGRDVEVLRRDGRRYLPRLEEFDVSAAQPQAPGLVTGGLYLITGGLGGIGRQLAMRLANEYQARLLVVGRSAINPIYDPACDPASGDDSFGGAAFRAAKAADRVAAHAALVKAAGEDSVMYAQVDAADTAALAAAVADAERRWGRTLDGIFHLAGEGNLSYHWTVADRHTIAHETPAMFRTMMRPKVQGMLSVGALLRERPSTLLVAFSSVNALYGGATFSAYSAANGFVAAYAQRLRRDFPNVYCIDWTMWDDVGMSRDNPAYAREASRVMGYRVVSLADGWSSLRALLCRAPDRYVVGLDAGNRHIQQDIVGIRPQRESLSAYLQLAPGVRRYAGDDEFRDTLGHRHRYDVTVCEVLPTLDDGAIDREALAGLANGSVDDPDQRAAPRNDAETLLLQIWKQILGLDRVGVHDNFFELGGDSVLSTQVVARANQMGMKLSSKQLFERQTIAELAEVATLAAQVRMDAEQGLLDGDCPLAPIQSWFFEQEFRVPSHWNQSLLLRVAADTVEPAAMRAALTALVAHHDALRLRYARGEDGWRQWYADAAEVDFESFDLSDLDSDAARAAVEARGAELQSSLDLEHGLRLRAAHFDMGMDGQRLLLVVHHLITDGVSWRVLIEDLATLYRAASTGRSNALPAKTGSYRAWTSRLRQYAQTSVAREQARYWAALAPQPFPLPLRPDGINAKASETMLEVELSVDDTQGLLRDVPAAYRSEINDALLTALLMSIRALSGQSRLLLSMEGHGREELFEDVDVSRTVGWFTSLYPLSLSLPEREDIGDCLKSVKEQLRAVPGKGLGYGIARYAGDVGALASVPVPEVSFNYLGQFDQVMGAGALFDLADEHPGPMQALCEQRVNALDIVAFVKDAKLKLAFSFARDYLDAFEVELLAERYLQNLRDLIAHCRLPSSSGLTPSDVPLLRRDQAQLDALVRTVAAHADPRQIETIYPATPVQRGLVYHSLLAPGEGVYVSHLMNQLRGPLDAVAFRQAWQDTIARHEIYRAMLCDVGGAEPVLAILRSVELPWNEQDWSGLDEEEQTSRYRELLAADRRRGFEFDTAPLMRIHLIRLGHDCHRFVLSEHHAVSDGWSRTLVLREVLARYLAIVRGEKPRLSESRRFRDYVKWLGEQDRAAMADYWRQALAGLSPRNPLTIGRGVAGDAYGHTTAAARHALSERSTLALQQFAKREQLTPSVVVQAAWALMLARYSGDRDVVFGSTVSGRPVDLPGADETVGAFINSLPVRVRIDAERPVLDWLRELHAEQIGRETYGHCALSDIVAWAGVSTGTPLFESVVVYENYPALDSGAEGALRVEWADAADQTELPLTLMVEPGKRLSFCLYHDAGRFETPIVQRLLAHLDRLIESIVQDAVPALGQLTMLTHAEQTAIDRDWNATAADFGAADAMLHELFSRQVHRTPDAIAVVAAGATFTYAEVYRRALALADALREHGVGPGQHVAVVLEKGWEQVVAVYAVLYAGGAYLPIDPAWPEDRRRYLIEHGLAKAVLTSVALDASLPWPQNVARLQVDRFDGGAGAAPLPPQPASLQHAGDLAYTIFTSGSTGLPKGVMIDHRGAVNTVVDINARFGVMAKDRVLAVSSLTFDLSVYDIFGPLAVGAAVVIPSDEQAKDPAAWVTLIRAHAVTLWDTVPALLQMLVDHLERERLELPGTLRLAMLSGDWIPLALPDRYRARFPGSRIVSMGGATEASIWSILYPIDKVDPAWTSIPYGKALANQRFYVLNEDFEPCPIGVRGALFIGGIGLALGYWRDEEKTARSFLVNPRTGERLYRTGDLGRYLDDGNIEFLGRADFQVKVNGYRIELGEIEAALLRHDAIDDALVIVREDQPGERRLVAYLRTDEVAGTALSTAELRAYLKGSLPDYMVPWHIMVMAQFPLSSNGKVDRKQLPAPEAFDDERGIIALGASPTEEILLGIWSDVLGAPVVDTGLNFFELGGHSLLTAQVIVRAREAFSTELPIRALFEAPTVAALAQVIDARRGGEARLPALVRAIGGTQLSYAQRRLWFLNRLEGDSATYNIATALRIDGVFDAARMARCLAILVERHDALRSRFVDRDGVPERIVDAHAVVTLDAVDVQDAGLAERVIAEARAPFDLTDGPLFRFSLFRLGDDRHVLLLCIHHIVADGWSVALLLRELTLLYRLDDGRLDEGAALPPVAFDYGDYVEWERAFMASGLLENQVDYWRRKLAGMPALLPLATDLPRPAVQTYRGATENFRIGPQAAARIKSQCARHGVTLYMYLLATLDIVLAHASGQRDIAIGATVANRSIRELEGIVGLFANQVVMRSDLGGDPRFSELLRQVRQVAIEAYAHQEAPFERVVEAMGLERSVAYTPLFQVKLVLQNVPLDQQALPGLSIETLGIDPGASKFDLQYTIVETADGLSGSLTYNTDIFLPSTATRLLDNLHRVIELVGEDPELAVEGLIADLRALDNRDRARLAEGLAERSLDKLRQRRRVAVAPQGENSDE